jgi:hypothetical protein
MILVKYFLIYLLESYFNLNMAIYPYNKVYRTMHIFTLFHYTPPLNSNYGIDGISPIQLKNTSQDYSHMPSFRSLST